MNTAAVYWKNLNLSPFLQQLYGYEVMTSGTRYILDEDREYFKLVLSLMSEGIRNGELRALLPLLSLPAVTQDFKEG